MSLRNLLPKRTLGWQIVLIIITKILVLMVIWHLLIKDHKVQGHTEALADYFLTPDASPQKQIIPRSPWE